MGAIEKRFLLWSFLPSYLCFGILLWLNRAPESGWRIPAAVLLFILCGAGPLTGAVQVLRRSGQPLSVYLRPAGSRPWMLAAIFLTLHFGLAGLLGLIAPAAHTGAGTLLLIPAAALIGLQELGWRMVLQPALAAARPFWKSALATALLQALWLLPLLFLTWSPLSASVFLPFTCCVIGMGFLSSALHRQGGGWPCLSAFAALFLLLTLLLPCRGDTAWYVMCGVDLLLSFLYISGLVRENRAPGSS